MSENPTGRDLRLRRMQLSREYATRVGMQHVAQRMGGLYHRHVVSLLEDEVVEPDAWVKMSRALDEIEQQLASGQSLEVEEK